MKVILFANTSWYLFNFRLNLAQALKTAGYEVVLVAPEDEYSSRLKAQGFRWIPIKMNRSSTNPFGELRYLHRICRIYEEEQPDLVHHFTVKCVIYGSIAAKHVKIARIVNSVTGLGYLFIGNTPFHWILRLSSSILFRKALSKTGVIFQNPDDLAEFTHRKLLSTAQTIIIRGSGVDINHYKMTSANAELTSIPLVLLPARMLWDKGVGEFVEAARILKEEGIRARFVLVGNVDIGNPSGIPLSDIEAWQKKGMIEWWGWREDMIEVYKQSDIVCLPSYREGLPKTLIEAAAYGLPIVTTDVPGCREVVQEGVNGLLVQPANAPALAKALKSLILHPEIRRHMQEDSRLFAIREFSNERIIHDTMSFYQILVPFQ